MSKIYPFCLNSKRWITVFFFTNIPKSCPHEADKECNSDECAYYEKRKATSYLLNKIKVMKTFKMDIIGEETS